MTTSIENMKLLSEYDSGGINRFDVDKEFFIIDSEHLADVETKLYGYSVQSDGIYEQDNFNPEAVKNMDGCGTYVYVERSEKEIKIQQDFNGSYGIYLFRYDDYYALSNSFFRLLEYIKYRYPLSLDRDYCNHIFPDRLTSWAYSETPVNEITLLERNAVIRIDTETRQMSLEYIDYGENTLSPDSEEGIAALDKWFDKWKTIFSALSQETDQISVNLSGGFDSRITFMLALKAGLPLDKIQVYSMHDNLHSHAEDFEIASEIGKYYGFIPNTVELSSEKVNYTLTDIINAAFYIKMPFHKEMYYDRNRGRYVSKHYSIQGAGGESVKSSWNYLEQEFIARKQRECDRYSKNLKDEICASIDTIRENGYAKVKECFQITDDDSENYTGILLRETRNRSHFGKATVEDYFSNTFILTPLIDPDLYRIKHTSAECRDHNLLMALIYERYCPQMLEFRIERNRAIHVGTIEYAKAINERFPFTQDIVIDSAADINTRNVFHVNTRDTMAEQILNSGTDNKEVPEGLPDIYLKAVFDSQAMRNLFTTYFDHEIYDYAEKNYKTDPYYPLRECYPVVGISKVLEDILFSEQVEKPEIAESLDRFIFNSAVEKETIDITDSSEENTHLTIQKLNQENKALEEKLKRVTNERNNLRDERDHINKQFEEFRNSTTFKVGKAIMALPCAVKRKITGE